MKISYFQTLLVLMAIVVFTSCQQDEIRPANNEANSNMSPAELAAFNEKLATLEPAENMIVSRAPISYTLLANGVSGPFVDPTNGSIDNPAAYEWYRFYANVGDVVTVVAHRITCGYDASFYRYTGSYADTDLLPAGLFNDDELAPACESCFSWGDPHDSFVAATGWYSIGMTDFANCEAAPYSYTIEVSGLSTFIIVDGCHTTTLNGQHNATTTMQQAIDNCYANAANSAAFVSCVTSLTNTWVSQGKITRAQKSKIITCAQGASF
jgi:hypothetical protein